VLCNFRHKSHIEREIEYEEIGDCPSNAELVKIVQELSIKLTKLEDKYNDIRRIINVKRKKINIIQWLNKHVTPTETIECWMSDRIIVRNADFDMLIEKMDVVCVFQSVLKRHFTEEMTHPIRAFCQREKTLFVFTSCNENKEKWVQSTNEIVFNLVKHLQFKFTKVLMNWKADKDINNTQNTHLVELFHRAVIKLMNVNEHTASKTKTFIYEHLKQDMAFHCDFE
jgi:hypothetical protein